MTNDGFSKSPQIYRSSRKSCAFVVSSLFYRLCQYCRDHIRIEKDGRLINTMEGPPVPTPQQSQRMKKYGEDIARRAAEQERKAVQNEFLRHSIRNSQKMRALKGNLHNYASSFYHYYTTGSLDMF